MSIDVEWVKHQMTIAKLRQNTAESVLQLIQVWNTMRNNQETEDQVLVVFSALARGHALVPEETNEERWVQAMPGYLTVGDEVRVKTNAYSGELGVLHNGRRCRIVGIRYGDIIVNTIDSIEPRLSGTRHSPYALEKRVL